MRALRALAWVCGLVVALLPVGAAVHAQSLEGVLMPGPVVAGHAKWENDCRKCHVPFDKAALPRLCADCHKEIAADIRDHTHFHGRLKDTNCRSCHTEHKGRKANITVLDPDTFDHDRTQYPLKGGHKKASRKCAACHLAGAKYRDAPHACNSCHRKDDVHKGNLGAKCEQCHGVEKWKTSFDHGKTRFKLELGHRDVACKSCHVDQRFKDTPLACASCHKKDDDAKGHKGRFGTKCETCHTARKWNDIVFDHDRDTKFVLRGKHEHTKCDACHTAPLYTQKTPTACVACHRKDDEKKGHRGSLGDKCENCHNETNWRSAKFDHDKETDFPLRGKHAKARCETCHTGGVTAAAGSTIKKLPTQCYACHRQDDEKKGHRGKFGEKCETCHTAKDWKDVTFDHDRDTRYALRGKHAKAGCAACHTGSLYRDKLATDCYACHRADDDKKGHKGALGTRCDACHNVDGWRVQTFDHNNSRFPLTGSHVRVACDKCHTGVAYRGAPTECEGCHRKDDVHKGRLGADCATCHNTRIWKSWDFDHAKTGFPLDGGHLKVECYACHATPMKKGPPAPVRACFACHAKDDVHRGAFGARCERCHGTGAWPAPFAR